MAKPSKPAFTAGWLFWLAVFLIIVPFAGVIIWLYRAEDAPWYGILSLAAIIASIGAGLITWAINGLFQWHAKRQKVKSRKKTQKR